MEIGSVAMPSNAPSMKTAFVFAGGGSFGAVQVGMLHALAAHGITADVVLGSSVGALNGAYYAGRPTIEGVRELEAIWRGLRRRDVFQVTWRTLFGFARGSDFLATSENLRHLVDAHLPFRNLEDAAIPIHVVATDILSGETVVLSEGPAADAILASAAIPPAFAPVKFEDIYLVDGAISSNTPLKLACTFGARRLIVLPTGYACALQKPPRGAIATALHALTLLIARQLISELESLEPEIEYYIVPPLCPLTGSPYDFSHTDELIARAVESTNIWIADGGLEQPRVHKQLGLHKHHA
jgi:NTE family protein